MAAPYAASVRAAGNAAIAVDEFGDKPAPAAMRHCGNPPQKLTIVNLNRINSIVGIAHVQRLVCTLHARPSRLSRSG